MKNVFILAFAFFTMLSSSGCFLLVPWVEENKETPKQTTFHSELTPIASNQYAIKPQSKSFLKSGVEKPTRYHSLKELTQMLEHRDPVMRTRATYFIGAMGPAATDAVPALIKNLDDSNKHVRRGTVKALGKIGDRRSIEQVKSALRDSDPFVRSSAENVLRNLGQYRSSSLR